MGPPPLSGLIFGYVLKAGAGCYRLDGEIGAMSKLKVLYGELNEEVLASQAEQFEKSGYQVRTAVGRKGVQQMLAGDAFELVILGATLTRDDRHHLPYMVKKSHAGAKVLVLHTDGSRHPYVDGNIDTGEDMQHILAKISAICQQPPAKAKAVAAKAGAC
jgi:hypothetical protein